MSWLTEICSLWVHECISLFIANNIKLYPAGHTVKFYLYLCYLLRDPRWQGLSQYDRQWTQEKAEYGVMLEVF